MQDGDEEDEHPSDEDYMPGKVSEGEPKIGATMAKDMAMHNEKEKKITEAQFSVNIIDLFATPKEMRFGEWNSRPLVESEWKKLKTSMTVQGIKSFTSEHMMPLVIRRGYVDTSCVQQNVSGYEAKTLVLSEAGERELGKLEMAGGRHRKAALESIKADKEKELSRLEKQHGTLTRRKIVKTEALARKMEALAAYEKSIAELQEEISKIGQWGVILYDKGKLIVIKLL